MINLWSTKNNMLDSITVQNVQTAKNIHLDLAPGINLIVGESDQGKTSIIRGLYDLITNAFSFDILGNWNLPIKSRTAKTTIVKDGHVISKIVAKTGSMYVLNGKEYKAPKQGIPDEIQSILNMDEINIQMQLDPHFLLQDISSGKVAKRLNEVVGLSSIDTTTYNINHIVRQIEANKKAQKSLVDEYKKRLQELEWVDDFEKGVNYMNTYNERYETLSSLKEEASLCHVKLSKLYTKEEECESVIGLKPYVDSVAESINKGETVVSEIESAIKHLKELKRLAEKLDDLEKMSCLNDEIASIMDAIKKYETTKNELSKAQELHGTLEKLLETDVSLTTHIENTKEQLQKIMDDIEMCPICGSNLNECSRSCNE